MRTTDCCRRRTAAAMAAMVVGAVLTAAGVATSASAGVAADGPPVMEYTTPQIARTAGGTAIRIEGSGFLGTTAVSFGGVAASFKVIDTNLLTATAPPALGGVSNASVPIEIVDNEGHGGSCEQSDVALPPGCTLANPGGTATAGNATLGVYYTDATISVTPQTGLFGSSQVRTVVNGYQPNASGAVVEMSPLVGIHEGGPPTGYGGPPPWVVPMQTGEVTDANGHLDVVLRLNNLGDINTWGTPYDPNISCPPSQDSADHGLPQCMVAYGQYAVGTLEHHITFANNPVPAPPTLSLSPSRATEGTTVSLRGVHWNNNAFFGSDTNPTGPGETHLIVEVCNPALTACTPQAANAHVDVTRYQTTSTTTPIVGVFSGATLSGSFVVSGSAGCAPNCVVRVRQEGFNYDAYLGQGTGTYISATAPLVRRQPADFDGNGTTDISIFRPSNGAWYVLGGNSSFFGAPGDIPVPGDYNGDGTTDFAVFRPTEGAWYIEGQPGAFWGTSGDVPVPGDYNGDGKTDLAVFRPSEGAWYIQGQPGAFWGTAGDVPVPADYNGDGKTDIAVFRPSTEAWYVLGGTSATWGSTGDIPVPGDYNGDGTTDFAVFRPSEGAWYVQGQGSTFFGAPGDMPQPGDYNGDGKTDLAVFRPSEGAWYVQGQAGAFWGTNGDLPLPLPAAIRMAFFSSP